MRLLAPSRPLHQLLLALVGVTMVPTLLTMGALSYVQYERQREYVTAEMVERGRIFAVALRERFEKVESALEDLAAQVPDDRSKLAEFEELARSQLAVAGVDAISLAAPSGQLVMSTRVEFGTPLPVASAGTMKIFRQGRRSAIDLTTGAVSGKLVAGVGVPVVRETRIRYAITAAIQPERFLQMIEEQKLPPGWLAAIVDSEGRIVARVPSHDRLIGQRVSGGLAERIEAAANGTGPMATMFMGRTIDGVDVVTSMRRSPVTGWTVVVNVPRTLLVTPVWRSAAWLVAFLALVFATTVSLALLISARIVSCIGRLRDAAADLPTMKPMNLDGLCFAEAQQLGHTLEDARQRIAEGKAEIEHMTHNFNRSLIREVEKRQQQVARELHDSVGSSLAGVSLLLGSASAAAKDNARLSTLLLKAHEQVSETAQHVREISRGMTPAGSEAGALRPAIEQFAAHLTHSNRVLCTVRTRGDFSHVPAETGTQVYRIVQEATANAIRHGEATIIRIMLAEHDGRFRLTVSDDGKGCDFNALANSHGGIGLRSMQARARAMDGVFEIGNRRRGGCRVRVEWSHADDSPELRTLNTQNVVQT